MPGLLRLIQGCLTWPLDTSQDQTTGVQRSFLSPVKLHISLLCKGSFNSHSERSLTFVTYRSAHGAANVQLRV